VIFCFVPSSIINAFFPNLNWSTDEQGYVTFIIAIAILIFDYIYYFRNYKTKEIIAKYSGRYKLIEESPRLAFLLFFILPLALSMFIFAFLSIKYPPFK
jgi:hypothetical protein